MTLHLHKSQIAKASSIAITGSKSESNRLLLLQALYPEILIDNISNSDDSQLMTKALVSQDDVIDIHHAGTAMRFLTAYFSIQKNRTITLTGSQRMKERPIKILVDALRALGADIEYVENEGYPPLKIKGKALKASQVTLDADVSSQYISALLLIGSKLNDGLTLSLEGTITSIPYINMTLALLEDIGIETHFEDQRIAVKSKVSNSIAEKQLVVESDWSSASYFYSIVALSPIGTSITLSAYKQNSLQGDSALANIYEDFGVTTNFENNTIVLLKKNKSKEDCIDWQLNNAPDIAQTIAVTCFGLGLSCNLTGLHTLKIKETDRLVALKTELEKLGGHVNITEDSLFLKSATSIKPNIAIDTYKDHRMAMAFAPLALKTDLKINDFHVVSKSYPDFWKDLQSIGFSISE